MAVHENGEEDYGEGRKPRYDGEDTSPTSTRELRGWYFMGLAAEIWAVCGVGSFAPVLLEQLARESGVLRADGVTPCIDASTSVGRFLRTREEENHCIVRILGKDVATPSFAMYTFSIAVFVQAVVLVMVSGVADYGSYRKKLLLSFAFTGAGAAMSMVLVWPKVYLLGSLFIIVSVVCLGSTFVLLNSFLPVLAANHPSASAAAVGGLKEVDLDDGVGGYVSIPPPKAVKGGNTSPELKLSTQISAKGVGLGYAAAVSVQVLSIGLLVLLKKAHFVHESTALRFVLLTGGSFWFLCTLPGALWLRNRPGPTLRAVEPWKSRLPAALQYAKFAFNAIWTTIRTATQLRQTWVFLLAWFLLSDAVATVSGTAILFARTELEMSTIAIALLSITATCSGIAGAFTWPKISKYFGLQTKQTILACVLMMEIVPLYGLLGFIPFVKSWGVLGLQKAWEIYPLGFVHGFVMGGLSSYCRAFYGEIIPPGSEAAFYALYAITDKGSSAVGPSIVGAIVDGTGTIRPAFIFLAVLIALPMPLLYIIDVGKGREEAKALSKHVVLSKGVGEPIVMEDFELGEEGMEGLLEEEGEEEEPDKTRRDDGR